MTPRRLPLQPEILATHRALPPHPRSDMARVGWLRKMWAVALHVTCMALFWQLVVAPVLTPIASGELAREFKPVVEALRAWSR